MYDGIINIVEMILNIALIYIIYRLYIFIEKNEKIGKNE